MNEDQKNINEFDDLFKTHNIEQKPPIKESNSTYFLSILYYLLIMVVLSTIVGIIFLSFDNTTITLNQDQLAIESVASDTGGFTLIDSSAFDLYAEDYSSYVYSIGLYNDFAIVINLYNTAGYDYLVTQNTENVNILQVDHLEAILSGERTYWDDASTYQIFLYESSLSSYSSATLQTNYIEDTLTTYTSFASSLLNFITYIALTPILALVLLRKDITADLLVYKKKWTQFIPPVLIGYALALVGNFVASFLSGLVAQFFGQMQSTASNQMIIEQSLLSNGVVFIFLSAVILGPIAEELIFRLSIFKLIKNEIVALIVSALAFGLIHLLNEVTIVDALINGIVYISLGFVFGYLYIRNKKNIAVNIAIHILYNLISVLAVLLLL